MHKERKIENWEKILVGEKKKNGKNGWSVIKESVKNFGRQKILVT